MILKIKKLAVNFEKSVLGTYKKTLGDTLSLRDKILGLSEHYQMILLALNVWMALKVTRKVKK